MHSAAGTLVRRTYKSGALVRWAQEVLEGVRNDASQHLRMGDINKVSSSKQATVTLHMEGHLKLRAVIPLHDGSNVHFQLVKLVRGSEDCSHIVLAVDNIGIDDAVRRLVTLLRQQ